MLSGKYNSLIHKIADLLSKLISPSTLWVIGIFLFSYNGFINSLRSIIIQGIIISLVSMLIPYFLLILINNNSIPTDIRNNKKFQNNPLILFAVIVALYISWLIARAFNPEQHFLIIYIFIVAVLSLLIFGSKFFFNCSAHMTAISAFSMQVSIINHISIINFIPLIFLVAFSRFYLKAHTIIEIVFGTFLGIFVTYIMNNIFTHV